jgi:hypothetical protein
MYRRRPCSSARLFYLIYCKLPVIFSRVSWQHRLKLSFFSKSRKRVAFLCANCQFVTANLHSLLQSASSLTNSSSVFFVLVANYKTRILQLNDNVNKPIKKPFSIEGFLCFKTTITSNLPSLHLLLLQTDHIAPQGWHQKLHN